MDPTRSSPVTVVRRYWSAIADRDWTGLRSVLSPDVRLYLPAGRELIVGAANVVALNAEYPDGWSIDVRHVVGHGDLVASEVSVPQSGVGEFRSNAWWTVRDGLIVGGREYWTTVGADEIPSWRAHLGRRWDGDADPF
jgi:ketosteroid isomerase-like protein